MQQLQERGTQARWAVPGDTPSQSKPARFVVGLVSSANGSGGFGHESCTITKSDQN